MTLRRYAPFLKALCASGNASNANLSSLMYNCRTLYGLYALLDLNSALPKTLMVSVSDDAVLPCTCGCLEAAFVCRKLKGQHEWCRCLPAGH